jgi:hypothetical protein
MCFAGSTFLTSSEVYNSLIGRPDSVVNDSCRAGIFFRLDASVVLFQVSGSGDAPGAFGSLVLSTPTPPNNVPAIVPSTRR